MENGRVSLPAEPGGWLSSPLALGLADSTVSEPAGDTPVLSLRRIAPPGFLTQAFAMGSWTGCAS